MRGDAPGSAMLHRVARWSALAGAASGAMLAGLFLARPVPPAIGLPLAYAIVLLGMLCVGGFAWIVLTLPRGAPWRRNGLRLATAVLGVALVAALAMGAAAASSLSMGVAVAVAGALALREG